MDLESSGYQARIDRLKLDDSIQEGINNLKRPTAINEKGTNIYHPCEEDELVFSNLEREDIEVYLRSFLFTNKCQRQINKFFYEVKWLHYT